MKRFGLGLMAIGCMAAALAAAELEKPVYGDSRPPRSIHIGETPLFTLEPGQSGQAEVVVAPDAAPYTRYAAEELSRGLGQMLGVEIPVTEKATAGRHHFHVGVSAASRAAGLDDAKLCRDAFLMATHDGDVYILGRDDRTADPARDMDHGGIWGRMREKGSLFGVYDLLERFGGCRFYFPGDMGTIVPEKRPLRIPEIRIFDRPDYEFRRVSIYNGTWAGQGNPYADNLSAERDRYYDTLRFQTRYIPNNHGLAALGYAERFGKDHPEYFALRSDGVRCNDPAMPFPGQLCYSSGVMDEIYCDAKALLTGQSAASRGVVSRWGGKSLWDPSGHQAPTATRPGIFGFMPQDAYIVCRCSKCREQMKDSQAIADFMWGKLAELAARLKADQVSGYLSLMSYDPYQLPPRIDLPDNILVMVATQGPWVDPVTQRKDLELIRSWNRKLSRRVWLWNYPGKFGTLQMPGIPDATPRAIGKYYGGLKNDISGAYMNSATDKLIYHALNYYIFSRVAWDNAADPGKLLDEYYRLMFGAAAPVMAEIFDRFETLWIDRIGGRTAFTELGPVSSPPSESEIWNNVYSPAELAGLTAKFDQAERLVSGRELERVRYMREEFLAPLKQQSAAYLERNDAIGGFAVSLSPEGAELHLQRFGAAETPVGTTVRVKETPDALVVAFDCVEPEMNRIVAVERQPGDPDLWRDNGVEIFLDPTGRRQEYVQILVNSAGSMTSRKVDAATGRGQLWNSEARAEIMPGEGRWRAVVTIPFKTLGRPAQDGMAANFVRVRNLGPGLELYSWSPFLKHGFQEAENFGTLTAAPAKSDSILPEGSFEVAKKNARLLGNWVVTGNPGAGTAVELDETSFVFGARSLGMTATDSAFNGYFAIRQYLPELKPMMRYELSFYLRTENVVPLRQNGGASVNIWDENNLWFPKNWVAGTQPWRRMRFEFTSRPGTNGPQQKSYLACCLYFATGKAWFDGITLRELGPAPATGASRP